jgi:hypothetical protein
MSKQINIYNSLFFLQPIDQLYSKKENIHIDGILDLLNISTDSETEDVIAHKPILMKDLLKHNTLFKIKMTNYLKTEWKVNLQIHRLGNYRKYCILTRRINSSKSLRRI